MPKPPLSSRGQRLTFLADLAQGWPRVRARTWVWASLIAFALSNISIAAFFVLGPLVARNELDGAGDWSVILTGGGVGGLLGAIAALRFHPSRPLRVSFPIMLSAGLLFVLLIPPAPTPLLAVAAGATVAAIAFGNTLFDTALQEHIPSEALSRVSAYVWMISLVFVPVGYAVAGPAADHLGVDATLWIAAALGTAANPGVLAVPSVRNLRRRVHEQTPARQLAPAVSLQPDAAE